MSTTEIIEAGIHSDVPMTDYINDPCVDPSLSKGVIGNLIHRSPLHAYGDHPRLGGSKDDPNSRSDLGSAAHAMLLGGAEAIAFIDAEDWRTKAAKEARDEARTFGRIPMLAKQAAALDAMVSISKPILDDFGSGDVEQTLIWKDGESWGRARPDWLAADRKVVVDYKTATNADPLVWIRRVLLSSDYDLQAAWYLRGVGILEGRADRDFLFLVQEITAPYACSVVGVGPEMMDLANRKIEAGLRLWRECMTSNKWIGYSTRTHWAELPQYVTWDWENRDVAYGDGERGGS